MSHCTLLDGLYPGQNCRENKPIRYMPLESLIESILDDPYLTWTKRHIKVEYCGTWKRGDKHAWVICTELKWSMLLYKFYKNKPEYKPEPFLFNFNEWKMNCMRQHYYYKYGEHDAGQLFQMRWLDVEREVDWDWEYKKLQIIHEAEQEKRKSFFESYRHKSKHGWVLFNHKDHKVTEEFEFSWEMDRMGCDPYNRLEQYLREVLFKYTFENF